MNEKTSKPSSTLFLGLQPQEFQDIYFLYLDFVAASLSSDQIKENITKKIMISWHLNENAASKIAISVIKQFESPNFLTQFVDACHQSETYNFAPEASASTDTSRCFISTTDYERYCELTSKDPHATIALKKLLLSLIVFYRRNYHKLGWVHYDKKDIIYLAGISGLASKAIEELTQYLHKEYGLSMRVIGSKAPMPCYYMDWLYEQSPVGSHINPILDLGPLCPQTIEDIVKGNAVPSRVAI